MNILNNAVNYLIEKYKLDNGFFCIYGSYATNTQTVKSDIDMLYIHRTNISKLKRTSEMYENIPISFYELSFKDLDDDANGKYGGFFCGKIFNPNVFIKNTNDDIIIVQKAVAEYFSHLINENNCIIGKQYTSDDILKNSICAYISLYPEYFSYILRLMKNHKFPIIWKQWKKVYIENLINENIIVKLENNNYIYNKVYSKNEFEKIKIDYISRFWIYGAISHDSDINFYDYYKNKNKEYILNNKDLKEKAENFLKLQYII